MAELPDPDRLDEDEPAVDVDEDDNLEVVPPDQRLRAAILHIDPTLEGWPEECRAEILDRSTKLEVFINA